MNTQTQRTIEGITCYGHIRIGNSVEVITDWDSFIVDNEDFTTWRSFIAWAKSNLRDNVVELVADNL